MFFWCCGYLCFDPDSICLMPQMLLICPHGWVIISSCSAIGTAIITVQLWAAQSEIRSKKSTGHCQISGSRWTFCRKMIGKHGKKPFHLMVGNHFPHFCREKMLHSCSLFSIQVRNLQNLRWHPRFGWGYIATICIYIYIFPSYPSERKGTECMVDISIFRPIRFATAIQVCSPPLKAPKNLCIMMTK